VFASSKKNWNVLQVCHISDDTYHVSVNPFSGGRALTEKAEGGPLNLEIT
jgi:hypothetical protein